MPSISRNKGIKAMKFGQLIKHKVRNNFPQNHTENEVGELFPDLFLFFEKPLYKVKASCKHLSFNMFC